MVECQIGDVADHDPERSPCLPLTDQRAPDARGSTFSRVDGDSAALRADTESQEEARDEQVPPGVCHGTPYTGDESEAGGDEDGPASTRQYDYLWGGGTDRPSHRLSGSVSQHANTPDL